MLRTENQVRLTQPEKATYRLITGESELPSNVEEFNQMVEEDALRIEREEDSAEARLLAHITRSFKVE